MQWSDAIKAPSSRMLRQFAGLWLIVFGAIAAWRYWHGQTGTSTIVLAVAAAVVGVAGLMAPAVVRPIYSGWMIAAFPVGWTMSKIVMGLMFYLVFTPVGLVFRVMGRDPLKLRRTQPGSYWTRRTNASSGKEYFRQS
jgi:hypothetical protein